MTTRSDLTDALAEVEGITAHPYVVGNTEPGTAFPRLDRVEYPNSLGGVAFWQVVVICPQDLASAEVYIEDKLPALLEALGPHIVVTAARPQRLSIPSVGELPALFLEGHREADA